MSFSLSRLHEKALSSAKRLRSVLDTHEETVGSIVTEAVRTGVTGAGAASAAGLDYFLGAPKAALPEAMVGPVPVVPVAALALKVAAFAMTKSKSGASVHLHAFSNGLGAASIYTGTLRLLQENAAPSS
jgi:hypothetical protein